MAFFQKWQEGQYRGDYPDPCSRYTSARKGRVTGKQAEGNTRGLFSLPPANPVGRVFLYRDPYQLTARANSSLAKKLLKNRFHGAL